MNFSFLADVQRVPFAREALVGLVAAAYLAVVAVVSPMFPFIFCHFYNIKIPCKLCGKLHGRYEPFLFYHSVRSSIRSKYISRVCMGCMAVSSFAVRLPCRNVHSSSSVANRKLKPLRK